MLEAGPARVEARPPAACALAGAWHGGRAVHRVGREGLCRRKGGGLRAHRARSPPPGGPGVLVLPVKARVARGPDVHLPALDGGRHRRMAVRLPARGARPVARALACCPAGPRVRQTGFRGRARRLPRLCRHAVPGHGVLRCLPVHLFVRGGPFPVPGEPGHHRPPLRRADDGRPAPRGARGVPAAPADRGRFPGGDAGCADLAPERDLPRRADAVPRDPCGQSRLLDGPRQPGPRLVAGARADERRDCPVPGGAAPEPGRCGGAPQPRRRLVAHARAAGRRGRPVPGGAAPEAVLSRGALQPRPRLVPDGGTAG